MEQRADLDTIFAPRAVAVVGASSRMRGPGAFVDSLLDLGFEDVYPVNPKADEIAGRRAYPDLMAIPGPVDHVISAIPAGVPSAMGNEKRPSLARRPMSRMGTSPKSSFSRGK